MIRFKSINLLSSKLSLKPEDVPTSRIIEKERVGEVLMQKKPNPRIVIGKILVLE